MQSRIGTLYCGLSAVCTMRKEKWPSLKENPYQKGKVMNGGGEGNPYIVSTLYGCSLEKLKVRVVIWERKDYDGQRNSVKVERKVEVLSNEKKEVS